MGLGLSGSGSYCGLPADSRQQHTAYQLAGVPHTILGEGACGETASHGQECGPCIPA